MTLTLFDDGFLRGQLVVGQGRGVMDFGVKEQFDVGGGVDLLRGFDEEVGSGIDIFGLFRHLQIPQWHSHLLSPCGHLLLLGELGRPVPLDFLDVDAEQF